MDITSVRYEEGKKGPEWQALRVIKAFKQKYGEVPKTLVENEHVIYTMSGRCVEWCEQCIHEAGGVG